MVGSHLGCGRSSSTGGVCRRCWWVGEMGSWKTWHGRGLEDKDVIDPGDGRDGSPVGAYSGVWVLVSGGAGVARWEAGAHIRTRSGVPKESSCPHAPRRAPPRWDRPPAPCSQREGRCMQPGRSQGNQMPGRWTGRARKGVGGGTRRLHSTTRITLISGGHSVQGPGSDNPRAGYGSEG